MLYVCRKTNTKVHVSTMVSINAPTHPISKTGFTLIIIRLRDLKVSVVRDESINIWLRAKDVSPWTTFYFLPVYFTLFERRLKCVKEGDVYCLKVWSAKGNSCRLQNCAFSPRKPNNFTYRLQVPAKIKVKVCSDGEIHGRSAGQYGQWEEAPVYPKGLRTSPTARPPHAIHIRSVRGRVVTAWILIETRVDARTRVGSPHLRQQEWCSHRKNAASRRCWEWG